MIKVKRRGRPPGSKNKRYDNAKLVEKEVVINRVSEDTVSIEKINNVSEPTKQEEDGVILFGNNSDIGIVYDKYCVIVKQRKINQKSGESYWVDAPSPFQRDLESAIKRIAEIYKRSRLKDSKDFSELIENYKKVHSDFMNDLNEFTSVYKGVKKMSQV